MRPSIKTWALAAIGLLAIASACSGGGSRSTPSAANQTARQQNAAGKNVLLHFMLPGQSPMSSARQLRLVQHNIVGAVATVTQPSPGPTSTTLVDQQQIDLSGPPNCDATYPSPRHCAVYINAKVGTDNIELDTYDTTPNTPGQIATPNPVPSPYCVIRRFHLSPPNCVPVPPAHALSVAITTGVTIAAGLNNVTLNMQPIVDQFATNGQTAYTVLGYPLCDPEPKLGAPFNSAPQQDTCSADGHPDYVISMNGHIGNIFTPIPYGYPGIEFLDGSTGPISGDGTCTAEDRFYNPIVTLFREYGRLQSGFTATGQLYKSPCGSGGYAAVQSNPGPVIDAFVFPEASYEVLYTGRGAVGTYNSNGTTTATGPSSTTCNSPLMGCAPYHNEIQFLPRAINTDTGLGPLPNICGGCSASAPGNDPPGGSGVGYSWDPATFRQEAVEIAPLYAVVVADSRCSNPSNFGAFACGGTLPAHDDTAFGDTARVVLGGPNTLAVVDAAQYYPPTGYAFYHLTLSSGCPSDLRLSVPNNGSNQASAFPGYTDALGNYTWGGQIFVLTAGNTLFTSSANCTATISDSFVTTPTISITNPSQTSANPGTVTFP
jgi:hypothetical protein